jgi:hypothetical protein
MSNDTVTSLIGATATVIAAWGAAGINARRLQTELEKPNGK